MHHPVGNAHPTSKIEAAVALTVESPPGQNEVTFAQIAGSKSPLRVNPTGTYFYCF